MAAFFGQHLTWIIAYRGISGIRLKCLTVMYSELERKQFITNTAYILATFEYNTLDRNLCNSFIGAVVRLVATNHDGDTGSNSCILLNDLIKMRLED